MRKQKKLVQKRVGKDGLKMLLDESNNELKYIHVTGTNGKGSVCAMTARILQCAGFREDVIADTIVKNRRVDIVRPLDSRYTDGVRSNAVNRLQMFCVHEDSRKFIAVQFQSEKHTKTHIINTALHGPVHRLGMISVVSSGFSRMWAVFP